VNSPRQVDRAEALQLALHRAIVLFHVLTLVAAAVVVLRRDPAHPAAAWAAYGVMALWTAALVHVPARTMAAHPRRWVYGATGLTVGLALATLPVVGAEEAHAGAITLPGTWGAGCVLLACTLTGRVTPLVVAGLVAAADLVVRGRPATTTVTNAMILVLAAIVVSALVHAATDATRRLAELSAQQAAEAASRAERERLTRDVHDGVLQTLAYLTREAPRLSAGEVQELAATQSEQLRLLLTAPRALDAEADVCALVQAQVADRASRLSPPPQLALPGEPVVLDAQVATAVAEAVGACLDNVAAHAPSASCFVLVDTDDLDGRRTLVVNVRDTGPGFAPDRLAEAARQGRLGVASSIAGRLESVGGTATIRSAPGEGTEVELRVSG
jgi:signal transduction histidine kinase